MVALIDARIENLLSLRDCILTKFDNSNLSKFSSTPVSIWLAFGELMLWISFLTNFRLPSLYFAFDGKMIASKNKK